MKKKIAALVWAVSGITVAIASLAQPSLVSAQVIPAEGLTVEVFASQIPAGQGPTALAFDTQGNLYIAPGDIGRILKIPAGTNIPQLFGAVGIGDADGVAVDSLNNIIVSGNPVTKFAPDGSVIWQLSCPAGNIQLVDVDSADNVYVGSLGTQICKIPPDGSSVTLLGVFSEPSEPAVSPDGFLYVSQTRVPNIVKATLDTAAIVEVVASGVKAAQPAFDVSGDLFIGDVLTGSVLKISLPGGAISTVASGFTFPRGLAFDGEGNLFIADSTEKVIYKIGGFGGPPPECVAPPSGLVSWWPGDGNADDIAGTNNGAFQGTPAFVTGEVGDAFSFDGASYVEIPHDESLDVTSAYTITAWVFVEETAPLTDYRPILVRGTTNANDIEVYVQFSTQDLVVLHNRSNGGTVDWVRFSDPPKGVWFHLGVTFDGTEVHAYYNGVAPAVTFRDPFLIPPLDTNKGWWIGKLDHTDFPSTPNFFEGGIDEVQIYDHALSQTEVQKIVNADGAGVCKDATPPMITANVTGTPGTNGWYVSDVDVTWTVEDPDSDVTSTSGCGLSTVTTDTGGVTFTCTATSSGGTTSESVTIKRDTVPPTLNFGTPSPTPNAAGWNNTDVSIPFTTNDATSGVASVVPSPSPLVISTEGSGVSGAVVVTDSAGNSDSFASPAVNIDKTPPTVAAAPSPPANDNGWNNTDVTVNFSGADGLSGVGSCSVPVILSAEGAGQVASGTCADLAGNSAPVTLFVNIDKTSPTIGFVGQDPPANAAGWNNTDVTLTWSCTDALSGAAVGIVTQTLSSETPGQGGIITTVAYNGTGGFSGDGGPAPDASGGPHTLTMDSTGNLYVTDLDTRRIRRVDAATGIITTVAGNGVVTGSIDGEGGDPADDLGDGGPATSATFSGLGEVAIDSARNLYIADGNTHRVRKVDAVTGIITTVAGNGIFGFSGDGGLATSASLSPEGLVIDGAGNLFIHDRTGERIRRVDAGTGIITTVAGNGTIGFSGDGGPAVNASFRGIRGLGLDAAGNLFIADRGDHRIRRVDAATGIITTVAGNGTLGFSGDGGLATSARLAQPTGVSVDSAGNLFIADGSNFRIRRVDAATGIITTVAGNGIQGFSGDGDPAISANLNFPHSVAVDSADNLFLTDQANRRVRRVGAPSQSATGECADLAGNTASDTQTGINIDKTPPTVTITDPTEGAKFNLNETVPSSYTCTDALSGMESCLGPVPSGTNIDTSSGGVKIFMVTGADVAGNQTTLTHTYTVNNPALVDAGPSATLNEGDTFSRTMSFTDPDVGDTHTASIDWGDGTPTQAATVNQVDDTFFASHTYDDNGTFTVLVSVTDNEGATGMDTLQVTVLNVAPAVSIQSISASEIDEGDLVTISVVFADPGLLDTHSAVIDWGDGATPTGVSLALGNRAFTVSHSYVDDNPTATVSDLNPITVTVTDKDGDAGQANGVVTVSNLPPVFGNITDLSDPVALGTTVALTAEFTDVGTADTHSCSVDWDDPNDPTPTTGTITQGPGTGACSASHDFAEAGVYEVTITVTDDDTGNVIQIPGFAVIYDPSAGFVTGGGFIDSPEGAYVPDPTLTGKANFGFVAKYKKGQQTPDGQTEFQFQAGDLNFHSSSYEWLVVAGARAQFKGEGTINGQFGSDGTSGYGFLLTAIDGQQPGGGEVDKFRMKIVDRATDSVVYDSGLAASDDIDADGGLLALSGGSVVIHNKGGQK